MNNGHPRASDGFEWTREAWGAALRCTALGEVAAHLFTARGLALERPDGDGLGWQSLARALGARPGALRRVRQVHGSAVACFRRGEPAPGHPPDADIVVTDDPSLAIAVQVADCVPLLVADRRTGAVAASHAGWRGAAAGVPGATVHALTREFGARAVDLVAAVGPSIGPCCYEVGEEVREAFGRAGFDAARLGRWFAGGPRGRPYLDLWRATVDQLHDAGVPSARIHLCALCTATHPQTFWSYRTSGPGTGRQAGVIRSPGRGA